MIGQTLGNHKVIAKIGVGGMGAVYLAEHPVLKTRVAIKVLLPVYSDRKDAVDRFFHEAQATALIHHRNLVRIFDLGTHDEQAYIVMEYLQGEDLGARLARVEKLSIAAAIDVAMQVAAGLAAAHSRGLVHRDLKPENIFLTPDPEDPRRELVKILDFGIAKLTSPDVATSNLTTPGMLLGTPLYMSPEQCLGAGAVDLRADIYSLGCVLFATIVGHPPFHNKVSSVELFTAHLRDAPPLASSLVPTVPPECDALISDLLLKNRDDRPKSMTEVASRMAQLRATLPDDEEAPAPRSTEVLQVAQTMAPGSVVPMGLAVGATAILPSVLNANESTGAPRSDERLIALHSTTLRASAGATAPPEEEPIEAGKRSRNRRRVFAAVGGSAALAVVAALLFSPTKPALNGPTIALTGTAGLQPDRVQNSPEPPELPHPVVTSGTGALVVSADNAARAQGGSAMPVGGQGAVIGETPKEVPIVSVFRVSIKNAREGITASIDGKRARLSGNPSNPTRSIMVPDDGQPHVLVFDTPRFQPFKVTVSPGRKAPIVIQNKLISF